MASSARSLDGLPRNDSNKPPTTENGVPIYARHKLKADEVQPWQSAFRSMLSSKKLLGYVDGRGHPDLIRLQPKTVPAVIAPGAAGAEAREFAIIR